MEHLLAMQLATKNKQHKTTKKDVAARRIKCG